ncbi:MAG: hypothetical protein SPJ34_09060 [Candidatus Ornithospirochaeta sp.]|nr:hypothetical protein [Candidatus Ornithospirochaeta sp.]
MKRFLFVLSLLIALLMIASCNPVALLMIVPCNPESAKTPEPAEEEVEVLIPRFISETDIGSRYIDITGNDVRTYYCMTSPLITGFEKRNHSFSNGKLELASEVLGRKIVQTIDKDADGNIVYDVHDEKGDSFVFTMVYDRKTKTFDYKQALLYTSQIPGGAVEHVMSTNEGAGITVTPQGDYYGKIKMRGTQTISNDSILLESDECYIESTKDIAVSVFYGLTNSHAIPGLSYSDKEWAKDGEAISFDGINALLDSFSKHAAYKETESGKQYNYGAFFKVEDSYLRIDKDPYNESAEMSGKSDKEKTDSFLKRNNLTHILTMVEGK